MPLSILDLAIFIAIIVILSVAVVRMNRWRPRAGWWLLGGAVGVIVLGNVVEKVTAGSSPLF